MIGIVSYQEVLKRLADVYEKEEFIDEEGNLNCPRCGEPIYEDRNPNLITVNGQILCPKCEGEMII